MITTDTDTARGRQYAGPAPLPTGAVIIGTVSRGELDKGALVRLASGAHVQVNAGVIRSLPPVVPVAQVQTIDLLKLARELGGIYWNAVPGKERVYLERGTQSKRVATKCHVYARPDGVLGVKVTVESKRPHGHFDEDGYEGEGWSNYRIHEEGKVREAVLAELKELGYKAK